MPPAREPQPQAWSRTPRPPGPIFRVKCGAGIFFCSSPFFAEMRSRHFLAQPTWQRLWQRARRPVTRLRRRTLEDQAPSMWYFCQVVMGEPLPTTRGRYCEAHLPDQRKQQLNERKDCKRWVQQLGQDTIDHFQTSCVKKLPSYIDLRQDDASRYHHSQEPETDISGKRAIFTRTNSCQKTKQPNSSKVSLQTRQGADAKLLNIPSPCIRMREGTLKSVGLGMAGRAPGVVAWLKIQAMNITSAPGIRLSRPESIQSKTIRSASPSPRIAARVKASARQSRRRSFGRRAIQFSTIAKAAFALCWMAAGLD